MRSISWWIVRQRGIVPDAEVASIVAQYRALAMLIANPQFQVTAPVGFGEAVVAFMNPGGIHILLAQQFTACNATIHLPPGLILPAI